MVFHIVVNDTEMSSSTRSLVENSYTSTQSSDLNPSFIISMSNYDSLSSTPSSTSTPSLSSSSSPSSSPSSVLVLVLVLVPVLVLAIMVSLNQYI